jgi:hypothetical protein
MEPYSWCWNKKHQSTDKRFSFHRGNEKPSVKWPINTDKIKQEIRRKRS